MSRPVVRFEEVSKRYYLGTRKAFVRELLPDFITKRIHSVRPNELWALRDVSFEVQPGEAFGIIGANGSGKTTTLSILAGITAPTKGNVEARGSVAALIQLGAGFHPELTGRENIYLNACILRMKKTEVDRIFDDIVQFAELENFIDTPVKRYSSGMYARLGFSVCAHMSPDVLLVDEVLAVGDMAFHAKCVARMHEFVRQGHSIIFVSHGLNWVQSLCARVMWLDEGRCMHIGPAMEVIARYTDEIDRRLMLRSFEEMRTRNMGTGDIRITSVSLRNSRGEEQFEFEPGDSLTVQIHYHTARRLTGPYFSVAIQSRHGSLFEASMLLDGHHPEHLDGDGTLSCTFKSLPLLPQVYGVDVEVRSGDGATHLLQPRQYGTFRVVGNSLDMELHSKVAESLVKDTAPVLVSYEWGFPDGKVHAVSSRGRIVFKK